MSAMLEVRDVSKHFGSLRAVQNVSLTVAKGELRAIIGPNGAGKTTFFNMISGFFPPTTGDIVFDGEVITRMPVAARVARGMARTFQITEIFPELTRAGKRAHRRGERGWHEAVAVAQQVGGSAGGGADRRDARPDRT